jgi:hypothetical protein
MARKQKRPDLKCPKCGLPIIVIPQGKRFRACDAESVTVIVPENGTAVSGYRRHVCAGPKVARARGRKAVSPPEPTPADSTNIVS